MVAYGHAALWSSRTLLSVHSPAVRNGPATSSTGKPFVVAETEAGVVAEPVTDTVIGSDVMVLYVPDLGSYDENSIGGSSKFPFVLATRINENVFEPDSNAPLLFNDRSVCGSYSSNAAGGVK